MMIAVGVALVLLAIVFVLLPLFRATPTESSTEEDPSVARAAMYQQILDAELDTRLGKLSSVDYQELRALLLADAARLISAEHTEEPSVEIAAQVEREIAEARAAMRGQATASGASA